MKKLLFLILLLSCSSLADLESQVQSVLPKPHESRWEAIPWVVDLNQARSRSQKSGKPIFCWIMDGHVLAAT